MTATAKRPKASSSKRRSARTKRIAFFNHKGGVSKTTTTFNLGWMLASKGHRVVLVDADPQCNLSARALGYKGQKEFTAFTNEPERNIRSGLPAFESRPKEIQAIECVAVEGNSNLFLLPGHIRFTEYEVSLGMGVGIVGDDPNIEESRLGSISYLLDKTGKRYDADYVLIDMNPSLSSINQNLVMTSDYFLVPASPDYFSVMAIDSLTDVLPRWRAWHVKSKLDGSFPRSYVPLSTDRAEVSRHSRSEIPNQAERGRRRNRRWCAIEWHTRQGISELD